MRSRSLLAPCFLTLLLPLAACGDREIGIEEPDGGTLSGETPDEADRAAPPDADAEPERPPQTAASVLREDGRFSTLLLAFEAAGMAERLDGGSLTLLAPTDEAWNALTGGEPQALLAPENRPALRALLRYHMVRGRVPADTLSEAETISGEALRSDASGDRLRVLDAVVIDPDVQAGDSVIHVIDGVLVPPE